MLHRNITERGGFRPLTDEEIEAVSGGFDGNQIIVTGRRLGAPGFGGGGLGGFGESENGLSPNPTLHPEGGGGDAGTGEADQELETEEDRQELLGANEDSARQEAIERWLEAELERNDPGDASWTWEYNENSGFYVAVSSDGRFSAVAGKDASDEFDRSVA